MSCFKYSLALHFSVVLGRLSSCDHLDLEKSPSVREVNAAAAGSRYTGRDDSLESFGSKLQLKSNLLFPPFCVSECTDAGLHIYSTVSLTTCLIPYPSFHFLSPFRSVASAEGCQEEAPQIALESFWDTIHYPHGFPPISCLLCWGIENRTSCQKRPHCLLHTHPTLQLRWDLFRSSNISSLYTEGLLSF